MKSWPDSGRNLSDSTQCKEQTAIYDRMITWAYNITLLEVATVSEFARIIDGD